MSGIFIDSHGITESKSCKFLTSHRENSFGFFIIMICMFAQNSDRNS